MAETSPQPETSTAGTQRSPSPPPNCAICLCNCINKCFSDSCIHQFCFKCLLEWSKVKAVCPLCKQPFNSIIHNVKSNSEYDEHFITAEPNGGQDPPYRDFIEPAYDLFVTPASRHFQFRTTFTVDPRGELAIQQLLSSHPLTNSFHLSLPSLPNSYVPRTHLRSFRHDTNFRRYIYDEDMWVHALPDITGRFRDVSPHYFRENPAARNRLVPWLNRELNALLYENTQHVMHVCDQILAQLDRHHLTSRYFNQLIEEYLGSRTDHFIHEFYNFMRSPYDMIGYDRVVSYSHALRVRIESTDDEDDDSDVVIVGTQQRTDPAVIEIESDSSHESDVIIREPTPPVVVDLVDSESEHEKLLLPLKIRLKRKRQNRERRSRRARERSSSESNSSAGSTTSSERGSGAFVKSRKKYQKQKYYIVKNTDSDSDSDNQSLNKLKKEWEDRKRKKAKKSKRKQKSKSTKTSQQQPDENETRTNSSTRPVDKSLDVNPAPCENNPEPTPQATDYNAVVDKLLNDAAPVYYKYENNVQSDQSASYTPPPRDSYPFSPTPQVDYKVEPGCINKSDDFYKSDVKDRTNILDGYPGPSSTKVGLHCNNWYSRPVVLNSDDDSD